MAKRVYSSKQIEQVRKLGLSNYKHGRPKCTVCGKQLFNYDAKYCKKHAHSGSRSYLYSKTLPQETKEKIRQKLKILYKDPSTTPNWKGGITAIYDMIRTLPETKLWKSEVFGRDGYTCQECGQEHGDIEAHHLIPFSQILAEFLSFYNQFSPVEDKATLVRLALTYDPFWVVSNGKTLCSDCHKLTYRKQHKLVQIPLNTPKTGRKGV